VNRDEILKMEAGPELDEAVCKAVGIEPHRYWAAWKDGGIALSEDREWSTSYREVKAFCEKHPQYELKQLEMWSPVSDDIASAFEVVAKMRERGLFFTLGAETSDDGEDFWWASFDEGASPLEGSIEAPTAPLALCRAALLAVLP
jgi:hypothetical protein